MSRIVTEIGSSRNRNQKPQKNKKQKNTPKQEIAPKEKVRTVTSGHCGLHLAEDRLEVARGLAKVILIILAHRCQLKLRSLCRRRCRRGMRRGWSLLDRARKMQRRTQRSREMFRHAGLTTIETAITITRRRRRTRSV